MMYVDGHRDKERAECYRVQRKKARGSTGGGR